MNVRFVSVIGLAGIWSSIAACDGTPPQAGDSYGSLSAGLTLATEHDVTAVKFDVVATSAGCESTPLASQTTPMETETLPSSVSGTGSGMHPFADGLFVLPPGDYRVCATPLGGTVPSTQCAPTSGVATVVAQQTNEVVLVSQCSGNPNGGVDIVVVLNDPPVISAMAITPSKFITTCESATIAVTATDPNGDALTYSWAIASGPAGASLLGAGASATFSSPGGAGDYVVAAKVTDVHGASVSLSFPIHVSAAICAVPDAVQAIFVNRCNSCHILNSAGGLHLSPPTEAYANLVGQHAVGVGCTAEVRVVPGNPAASYLIAKLRGAAGICGVQMPRGRPPLPEAEINTIEAWIAGLPH